MNLVTFKLTNENAALTEEEKRMIEAAKKLPVIYDEDSPELTESMERAFITARKAKLRNAL